MKVTHFGVDGFPWAHVSNFGGVTLALGSNTNTDPPLSALNYVQRITANGSNVLLNPIVNFAAGSNILLTLDQGPLPAQAMPSNTIRIHSTGGSGGNIITANGSNSLAAVVNLQAGTNIALGVSGQTITITNTQAASGGGGGSGSSGGWTLLEKHTASSSESLDFTTRNATGQSGNTFQTDFDMYVFVMVQVLNATNTRSLVFQVTTNSGSTYDTGSNYNWSHVYSYPTATNVEGSLSQTSVTISGSVDNSHQGVSGTVEFYDPLTSSTYKTIEYRATRWVASGINTPVRDVGGGQYTSNTAINGVRFLYDSGNITSGTIYCYGVPKS